MSVDDLLKQIEKLRQQIEEIQDQCPHLCQEKYRRGGDIYETRCLECRKIVEGFMGYVSIKEINKYKVVSYDYNGCEDPEAHKMYHAIGAHCPCV